MCYIKPQQKEHHALGHVLSGGGQWAQVLNSASPSPHSWAFTSQTDNRFPVTNDAYQILWQWQVSTGWVLLHTSVLSLQVQGEVPSPRPDKALSLLSKALRHGVYKQSCKAYIPASKGLSQNSPLPTPHRIMPHRHLQSTRVPKCLQGCCPNPQWPVLPWSVYLLLSTSIEILSH